MGSFGRVSFGKSLEKKSVPVWCDYDAVFVFLCKPFLPSIMNQLVELHCLGGQCHSIEFHLIAPWEIADAHSDAET